MNFVKTAFGLAIALLTSSPASAQMSSADIFIGTLAIEQGQVFLDRCALGDPRYVLRDDPDSDGNPLDAIREGAKGAYAEVIGIYSEVEGRHTLLVRRIENVTPDRNCHLTAAPGRMVKTRNDVDPTTARMEPLLPTPGKNSSQCTAAGDWCVILEDRADQEGEITISRRDVAGAVARIPVAPSDARGFDRNLVSIWPVWTRLAGGGGIVGVIREQRTMYSGGGASASTLTLYRVIPGSAPSIVLDLPWEASSMIRACFSEKDFRQRAGACHDEYKFQAQLSTAPEGTGAMPVLRYDTETTSFPGPVSRSADSLAARPLKRRDLVHVKNDGCSITRLFRFDAAAGRYMPDAPLPDCSDYTDL